METSTVPPASTGAPSAPNIMNSSIAPPTTTESEASLPSRTTEAEASLPSRLDLSTGPFTAIQPSAGLADAAPPPTHSSIPHHPPYAEMITTAIRALDDRKGSSRTAIKKYIDSTYPNLPPSHSALLSRHLKKLKNSGSVVMVKHSYKLPKIAKLPSQTKSASAAAIAGAAPSSVLGKRGRGRPPKPKPSDAGSGPGPGHGPALASPKRGPGRPPKSNSSSVTLKLTVGSDGQLVQKRGRGRPPKPKLNPMLVPGSNGFVAPPKPRRQPKKPRPIAVTASYGLVAPKQPRKQPKLRPYVATPRKDAALSGEGSPRPRGRPRKNAVPFSSGNVKAPVVVKMGGSRPRGRPPKVHKHVAGAAPVVVLPHAPAVDAASAAGGGGGGGVTIISNDVVSPEKRGRGRPRKAEGEGVKPKRPVGRPKKIIITPTATAMV